jgi:hypothetical protein
MDSSFTPIEQMLKFRASRMKIPVSGNPADPPVHAHAG